MSATTTPSLPPRNRFIAGIGHEMDVMAGRRWGQLAEQGVTEQSEELTVGYVLEVSRMGFMA